VTTKPKIALYWCSSCGGCEESVIDLAEEILTVADRAEIVFWPVALDFKHEDVAALKDGSITATLINGAIRMDEQVSMAKLLRRKSRLIFAHGACAHLGGVVGLANFSTGREVLRRSYEEVPSVENPEGILPQVATVESRRKLTLPGFHDTVKALDQVVAVDYYIPGCPPPPELVKDAIMMMLEGRLPPKGRVLADTKALCHTCPRRDTRLEGRGIKKFVRVHETEWDPDKCFLNQGIICLGPATRGGCGAQCIEANMPCRGCFGPTDKVLDHGAKSLSFLASLMDATDEDGLEGIVRGIPDLPGLMYRYSLASSLMRKKISGKD
jgi:F420-non-reducing hydrogenase small subunit